MDTKKTASSVVIIFLGFGFGTILFNWFQNELYNIFTPFIILPIWLGAFALFIVMLFWALAYLTRGIKHKKMEYCVPVIVIAITVIMQFCFPYEKANLSVDYLLNQPKREDIVRKIIASELHEDKLGLIKLPSGYKYLSKGREEVLVEREEENIQIFFFTVRGMLNSGSTGYIFVSDESMIENGIKNGTFARIEKKKDNWYWGWME